VNRVAIALTRGSSGFADAAPPCGTFANRAWAQGRMNTDACPQAAIPSSGARKSTRAGGPHCCRFCCQRTKTHKNGLKLNRSSPYQIKVSEGQVGQESHLQPAVLEPAAVGSATFRRVHEQA
jgi:hypothetical protein